MKILVVDDDPLTLTAIAHCLSGKDMEVITAENGFDAIKYAQEMSPDLIICDILMPDMSGLSLLCLLKQFYFDKVPVIMMSSLDKADMIMASLGLGAEDFLSKPIDFGKLSERVRSCVG
jgi:DNA-binding response OmpR family regulator